MPLPNGPIGVKDNPLIKSPFIQDWDQGVDFPPPGSDFRITNASEDRVTNAGDKRITN